jgi:hypothetical protein
VDINAVEDRAAGVSKAGGCGAFGVLVALYYAHDTGAYVLLVAIE